MDINKKKIGAVDHLFGTSFCLQSVVDASNIVAQTSKHIRVYQGKIAY